MMGFWVLLSTYIPENLMLLEYVWGKPCYLNHKCIKPVGTTPVMIYELCKIDRDISYNVISFPSILSAINTLAYKLAKISITFLKSPD